MFLGSCGLAFVTFLHLFFSSSLQPLFCRAVQHPRVPETQEFVRVHSYQSKMVIRPHKSFDEVCDERFALTVYFFSVSATVPCFLTTGFDLCVVLYRMVLITC